MKKALFLTVAAALVTSCGHKPDEAANQQQATAQDIQDDAIVARMSAAADSVRLADQMQADTTRKP